MNRLRIRLTSLVLVFFACISLVSVAKAEEGNPPEPTPIVTPAEHEETAGVTITTAVPEPADDIANSLPEAITEETAVEVETTSDESEIEIIILDDSGEQMPVTSQEAADLLVIEEAIVSSETIADEVFTDLSILDDSGNLLPLASEEASNLLVSGDPIWCPASTKVPKPNLNGCTPSFTSLADLFTHLESNPKSVDGTIWIEKNYSSTVDATLDGALPAFGTMRNFRVTFKGGWNGCGATPPATCVGTIDIANPSEVNHQIEILDWNNDITISDLLITQVVILEEALAVETTGKITLMRVEVSENDGAGASLDNSDSVKDVSITASTFNDNVGGDGLQVKSKGTITISDITANTNAGDGANLDNSIGITLKAVTLLGVNIFSENTGSGLVITSSGAINAFNLVNDANASKRGDFGQHKLNEFKFGYVVRFQ